MWQPIGPRVATQLNPVVETTGQSVLVKMFYLFKRTFLHRCNLWDVILKSRSFEDEEEQDVAAECFTNCEIVCLSDAISDTFVYALSIRI